MSKNTKPLWNTSMRHRKGDVLPSVVVMKRMAIGYVLINVQPGTEQQVYNDVRNLPHVTDATVLFGDHDLIVKLRGKRPSNHCKSGR